MSDRSLEIRLASRPAGEPEAANFELAETGMPAAGAGQALVRNVYMSVDPYMRGRMRDIKSYTPPFAIGKALDGGAVGVVEESNTDALSPGDLVSSRFGWRSHFAAHATELQKLDTHGAPLSAFLGVLGMPGHDRLRRVAGPRRTEGGRDGVRIGRRRRGRQPGRPDRQDQGLPRRGQRRVAGQGRPPGLRPRLRRRLRLPRRPEPLSRRDLPRRHRRLLRERRRDRCSRPCCCT